jgi:hypothetical protein
VDKELIGQLYGYPSEQLILRDVTFEEEAALAKKEEPVKADVIGAWAIESKVPQTFYPLRIIITNSGQFPTKEALEHGRVLNNEFSQLPEKVKKSDDIQLQLKLFRELDYTNGAIYISSNLQMGQRDKKGYLHYPRFGALVLEARDEKTGIEIRVTQWIGFQDEHYTKPNLPVKGGEVYYANWKKEAIRKVDFRYVLTEIHKSVLANAKKARLLEKHKREQSEEPLKTKVPILNLQQLAKLYEFPEKELVVEHIRNEESRLLGMNVIAAYQLRGKEPQRFYPLRITITNNGRFPDKEMKEYFDFRTKYELGSPPEHKEKIIDAVRIFKPLQYANGSIYPADELRVPFENGKGKAHRYYKKMNAIVLESRDIETGLEIRIAQIRNFRSSYKDLPLVPIPGGEKYYERWRFLPQVTYEAIHGKRIFDDENLRRVLIEIHKSVLANAKAAKLHELYPKPPKESPPPKP